MQIATFRISTEAAESISDNNKLPIGKITLFLP